MENKKNHDKKITETQKIIKFISKIIALFASIFFVFIILVSLLFLIGNYQEFSDLSQIFILNCMELSSSIEIVFSVFLIILNFTLFFFKDFNKNTISSLLFGIFSLVLSVLTLIFSASASFLSKGIQL